MGRCRRLLLGLSTRGIRSISVCLAAATLGAAAAACASSAPLPVSGNGAWTTRTVDQGQVSLSVPSNWNAGEAWIQASSFSDLVGSFSNQSLSPPCTTGPNTIECGPPLTSLQPGAMLVEIWQNGSPNWTLDSQPGTPTLISGLPARVTDQTGSQSYCSAFGADRTSTVVIAFPSAPDNYFEIDICSRGLAETVGARIMKSVQVTPHA